MSLPFNEDVSEWSIPDVKRWLMQINCDQHVQSFGDKYVGGYQLLQFNSDSFIKTFPHIEHKDRVTIVNAVTNYRSQSNHQDDQVYDDEEFSDDEYWAGTPEEPVNSGEVDNPLSYDMACSMTEYEHMDDRLDTRDHDDEPSQIYDAVADEPPTEHPTGYRAPPRPPKLGASEPLLSEHMSSIPLIDAPSPPRAQPSKPLPSNDQNMHGKTSNNYRPPAPIPTEEPPPPARPNKPLPSVTNNSTLPVQRPNKPLPTPGNPTSVTKSHTPPKVPPTNRGPPVPKRPPETDGEDYEEVNTQNAPPPEHHAKPIVKHNFTNKPTQKPFEQRTTTKPFEPKPSTLHRNEPRELPKPPITVTPPKLNHSPPSAVADSPPNRAPPPPSSKNKPLPSPTQNSTLPIRPPATSPVTPKSNTNTNQGGPAVAEMKKKFGDAQVTPKPPVASNKPKIADRMKMFEGQIGDKPPIGMKPNPTKQAPSIHEQIQQAQRKNRESDQEKPLPKPLPNELAAPPPAVRKTTPLPVPNQTGRRPSDSGLPNSPHSTLGRNNIDAPPIIPSTDTLPTRQSFRTDTPPPVPATNRPAIDARPLPSVPSSGSVSSRGSHKSESEGRPPALPSRPMPKASPPASLGHNGAGDSDEDPYLYTYHWFHGHIDRTEAIKRLKGRHAPQDGFFLIRNSIKDPCKPFTIDVMYREHDFHVNIRRLNDGRYCLGENTNNTWKTIPEFVDYFKSNRLLLKSKNIDGSTILREFPYRR